MTEQCPECKVDLVPAEYSDDLELKCCPNCEDEFI